MRYLLLIACSLTVSACAAPAVNETNIALRAEHILSAACQYLADAHYFSLNAEVWREHVTESGQKVQFSRTVAMEVKRPNHLHMEIASPHSQRQFWYGNKALTILDKEHNVFSSAEMPGNLDDTLDQAHDRFGIDLPLVDLVVSNPFKNAMARVLQGRYYGLATVSGIACHHLAFTQTNIDWQVWVQEGPQPLIRKIVITHKREEGAPEFTAFITHWDLVSPISDSDFVFDPPRDARKIEMRPDQPGRKTMPEEP